jgi:septum formation protein
MFGFVTGLAAVFRKLETCGVPVASALVGSALGGGYGDDARVVAARAPEDFVLAADTVVAVGRRILPKAETEADVLYCLRLLSGRNHKVLTGVALIAPGGRTATRLVETKVGFKRLSEAERDSYVASGQWRGKAGGYGVQGLAGGFITDLQGSYPSVVGLPLYETLNLLSGLGYRP